MKLKEQSSEESVLVQIKTKQRDTRETVKIDNPGKPDHGKEVKNKRYGMFYYETVENGTFELLDTKPSEVREVIMRALAAASKGK